MGINLDNLNQELQPTALSDLVARLGNLEKDIEVIRLKKIEELTRDYIDLKQKLIEFPEQIMEQKEYIAGLEDLVEQAQQEVQLLEDMQMLVIQDAEDENGKKKYSNQAARDAAMNKWKNEDTEYQAALNALKEAKRNLENAQLILDRLYNEYRSVQKTADLLVARMNMLG